MRPSRRIHLRCRPRLVGLLSLAITIIVPAQVSSQSATALSSQWDDAVHSLVDKITSALSSHSIWLNLENVAGLGAEDASTLQGQFQSELTHRGFEIKADSSAETRIQITLSQGAESYVLVAEIKGKSGEQVTMVNEPFSRTIDSPGKPMASLQAKELFLQPEPILDFAQAVGDDGGPSLFLLEPDRLARFEEAGGTWTMRDSVSLPSIPLMPRDLRGRIDLAGPHGIEVSRAGISCTGSWYPTLTLNCGQQHVSEISPLGGQAQFPIPPDRIPASYSVASNSVDGHVRWIETKPDGTAQLFQNSPDAAVATFSGWGDDVVSIAAKCSSAWHILVTGTGDWTYSDRIQMYEVAGRQAIEIGRPLGFSGPVLALWQSDGGESARVISRDLQTGMYEASIVSVSCGN
jgi:hypothetical protein